MKWFVTSNFGLHPQWEVVEADSYSEAEYEARRITVEYAESYGFYQDSDHFGNRDEVGCDWDAEEDCYNQSGWLEYEVVAFEEELHKGCLS